MIRGSRALVRRIGAVGVIAALVCGLHGRESTATAPANLVVNRRLRPPGLRLAFSNGHVGILSPAGYTVNKLPVKRIPGWANLEGTTNGAPNPNAGGAVVFQKARLQAPDGSAQSLELSNNGPGAISETVKTTAGASYLLTWYGAGYPDGKSVKIIKVSWDNSQIAAPSAKGGSGANMGWTVHHEVVKATGATSILEFADATSPTDSYGPLVGAVSLVKQAG